SLTGQVRPMLARMLDELTKPPPAPVGADGWQGPAPATLPLDPDKFKSAIYRQFGAHLEVTGIVDDRTAALDRLSAEVAASLVQQRERVLDISEEVLQGVLDEHCPPNQHVEDWDLEALANGIKERFGFQPTLRTDRVLE